MKILIADDDPGFRLLMHQYLTPWGQCDLVHNGAEALEAFTMAASEDQSYDLICLDLFMPIMNGDATLQAIRLQETQQGIPGPYQTFTIIITGQDPSLLANPLDECTTLLMKPITREKLYETLRLNGFTSPSETSLDDLDTTTQLTPLSPNASAALEQELNAIPGLDMVSGMDRVMGNIRLYREILQHFVTSHGSDLEKFQAALDAGTPDMALRIIHGLKGSAGNISAQRLHLAAKEVEALYRRNAPPTECVAPMAELTAAMNEILPALRALTG